MLFHWANERRHQKQSSGEFGNHNTGETLQCRPEIYSQVPWDKNVSSASGLTPTSSTRFQNVTFTLGLLAHWYIRSWGLSKCSSGSNTRLCVIFVHMSDVLLSMSKIWKNKEKGALGINIASLLCVQRMGHSPVIFPIKVSCRPGRAGLSGWAST